MSFVNFRHFRLGALAALALLPASFAAAELAAPTGEVVLTVSGLIGTTNGDGTATFDMAMLEALPVTEFVTATIWTDGPQTFTGVSLHDLLAAVDASGGNVHATAINDYAVDIPAADAVAGGPIVAYRLNGETMSVRDKGPLWIIYPFDLVPEYQSEVTYSRSIWQLDRIEIME